MITSKTQAAIAVLNDIYAGGDNNPSDFQLTEQDRNLLQTCKEEKLVKSVVFVF